MFTHPLLSICIPTRNRPNELSQLLESIASQPHPEIEVVVSDNSDTDETLDVLSKFKSTLQIQTLKQSSYVSFGENLYSAVSLAKGAYVWLMGDDDLIADGAIQTILHRIHDARLDCLLVNTSVWNFDFSVQLIANSFQMSDEGRSSKAICSRFSYLNKIHFGVLTFMGSHIWKKRVYDPYLSNYKASNYPHVLAFIDAKADRIETCTDPAIKQRFPVLRQYDVKQFYLKDYPEIYRAWIRNGNPQNVLKAWKKSLIKREIVRGLARSKESGQKLGFRYFLDLSKEYLTIPAFWLFVVPVFLAPRWVLSMIKSKCAYSNAKPDTGSSASSQDV